MKVYLVFALSLWASAAYGRDVYYCVNENGTREYRNTSPNDVGCRKVDPTGRGSLIDRNPKLPVSIGMSKKQVLKNWGPPADTSHTQTRNKVTDTWTYSNRRILTFVNDSLEVIQN